MYGLGDDFFYNQDKRIQELRDVLNKCRKYIKKLPNENKLEKSMILGVIKEGLLE